MFVFEKLVRLSLVFSVASGLDEQQKGNRDSHSKSLEYEFDIPEISDQEDYPLTPETTNQSITDEEIDEFLDKMNLTGKALEFIIGLEKSDRDVNVQFNEWLDSIVNSLLENTQ